MARFPEPEKVRAHRIVSAARRSGELVPTIRCECCDEFVPLDAHHEDYAKPLDVLWLCRQCHKDVHNPWRYAWVLERCAGHEARQDAERRRIGIDCDGCGKVFADMHKKLGLYGIPHSVAPGHSRRCAGCSPP